MEKWPPCSRRDWSDGTLARLQAACTEQKIVATTAEAAASSAATIASEEGATSAAPSTATIDVPVPGSVEVRRTSLEEWPPCCRRDWSDGTIARLQAACTEQEFVPTTEAAKVLASVLLPKLPCHLLNKFAR